MARRFLILFSAKRNLRVSLLLFIVRLVSPGFLLPSRNTSHSASFSVGYAVHFAEAISDQSQVIDGERLQKCKIDLVKAGGEKSDFYTNDFTNFIRLYSNNEIDVPDFPHLPLPLIQAFTLLSCSSGCHNDHNTLWKLPDHEASFAYIPAVVREDGIEWLEICSATDRAFRQILPIDDPVNKFRGNPNFLKLTLSYDVRSDGGVSNESSQTNVGNASDTSWEDVIAATKSSVSKVMEGCAYAEYHPDTPVAIVSTLDDDCPEATLRPKQDDCIYVKVEVPIFITEGKDQTEARRSIIHELQHIGINSS